MRTASGSALEEGWEPSEDERKRSTPSPDAAIPVVYNNYSTTDTLYVGGCCHLERLTNKVWVRAFSPVCTGSLRVP